MIQLLAPIVPYVTDAIYQALFASAGERVHLGPWPEPAKRWVDDQAERIGEELSGGEELPVGWEILETDGSVAGAVQE